MADRLRLVWQRFRPRFRTQTRDGAASAYDYLSGLLRLKSDRSFANIGRQMPEPPSSTGNEQRMHHFMSNSPWSGQEVIKQVQQEIAARPELQGGMLLLDESADEKASEKTIGAGRQRNGRLGKVEMSQMGTFLAYCKGETWLWVDGELYLQAQWFTPERAAERKKLGLPEKWQFETKIQLGWKMIQRAVERGLPFEAVGCDALYGRAAWFRQKLEEAGLLYIAEVPDHLHVYLREPQVLVPVTEPGRVGRPNTRERAVCEEPPLTVEEVACQEEHRYERVRVRTTERGVLEEEFAARRVWTVREGKVGQEWLVIRREENGRLTYALSNAPAGTSLVRLAWLKCQRYFVERANQESKSEIGWDELRAQKYRAWEHQVAMTILAMWYIAETKLDWAKQYPRDPQLTEQFAAEVLPALSVANVREMLCAAMPLPQLTPTGAAELVVKHLVGRTRARKSRMQSKHHLDTS